jgi:hypothetical protein
MWDDIHPYQLIFDPERRCNADTISSPIFSNRQNLGKFGGFLVNRMYLNETSEKWQEKSKILEHFQFRL